MRFLFFCKLLTIKVFDTMSIIQKMADLKNEIAKLRNKYNENGYSYKTEDGTTFVADSELAKDVHLYVIDETGNRLDAPVGSYKIEGVGMVEVAENGMISNIVTEAPAGDGAATGDGMGGNGDGSGGGMAPSISEEDMMKIVAMVVGKLKEEMASEFSAVSSLTQKVEGEFQSVTKSIVALADVVEKLGESPQTPPKKDPFAFAKQGPSREDRVQELAETLKSLKTNLNK
jgi:hypothetical protein